MMLAHNFQCIRVKWRWSAAPVVVSTASKHSAARRRSQCPVDGDYDDDVDDDDEDGGRQPWLGIVSRHPAAPRSKRLRFARGNPSECGDAP